MLQFLLKYPIKSYAKTLFSANRQGPAIVFYFGEEKQMLLVQGKTTGGISAWEPNLKAYIGAPNLASITKSEVEMENPHVPSSYRRELAIPLKIMNQNDTHIIIEDSDLNISLINCEEHKTVGSIKSSLEDDPSELIPLWTSYNSSGEFTWEVLDLSWRTMGSKEETPKKVFVVGYPEEKILAMCRWAEIFQIQLLNILPVEVAVNRLIQNFDQIRPEEPQETPRGNYILLFQNEQEANLSFFTRGKTLVYNPQKTREGFNTNETVEEIEDIQDQEELNRNTPIHLWGVDKQNYLIEALRNQGWTNVRLWEPERLTAEDPILVERNPERTLIEHAEPWLMKYCMQ